jgi:hypothetical protein
VNKSLDNKEEITSRSAKEKKSTEEHKRVTGYLKNMRGRGGKKPKLLLKGSQAAAVTE